MDFANVQATLEQEVKTSWPDQPIVMDERVFKDAGNAKYFIRHQVIFGHGETTSLGGGCYRYPALQYLSIFYRPGEGLDTLLKLVDRMVKHYSLATIGTAVFYVASFNRFPVDAKGFAQLQVVCPFYFDYRS